MVELNQPAARIVPVILVAAGGQQCARRPAPCRVVRGHPLPARVVGRLHQAAEPIVLIRRLPDMPAAVLQQVLDTIAHGVIGVDRARGAGETRRRQRNGDRAAGAIIGDIGADRAVGHTRQPAAWVIGEQVVPPVRIGALDQPAGAVVAKGRRQPGGVGAQHQAAVGVVLILGRVAERIGDPDQPVEAVVRVGDDFPFGVDDPDQVTVIVVGVSKRAAERVGQLDQPVAGVVLIKRELATRVNRLRHNAGRIVCMRDAVAQRIGYGEQVAKS